jgi:hypothetical protein
MKLASAVVTPVIPCISLAIVVVAIYYPIYRGAETPPYIIVT